MYNIDYHSMSNKDLLDLVEQGEMQNNYNLCTEFMRRMDEYGITYENTPDDIARWKSDVAISAQRIQQEGMK